MQKPLWKRLLFGAIVIAIGAIGLWAYLKFVWYAGPTIAWKRNGQDYELLAPRMLGIALLAPYFVWMIGRSLADLPWPQRILSVLMRVAFVALLALGLSRLARTATTQKVCTVYLVDVSESIPDAAIVDAKAEIQKGLDQKPEDALDHVLPATPRDPDGRGEQDRPRTPSPRRAGPRGRRRQGQAQRQKAEARS